MRPVVRFNCATDIRIEQAAATLLIRLLGPELLQPGKELILLGRSYQFVHTEPDALTDVSLGLELMVLPEPHKSLWSCCPPAFTGTFHALFVELCCAEDPHSLAHSRPLFTPLDRPSVSRQNNSSGI